MSFCIELFCVVTLQYQILVRIAIAYFIIEKKKAAPQPWQAIAQRFCSIMICILLSEIMEKKVLRLQIYKEGEHICITEQEHILQPIGQGIMMQ